jgi:hypothetical protein
VWRVAQIQPRLVPNGRPSRRGGWPARRGNSR